MDHVNMDGVIHYLIAAEDTLDSHVPYRKDGDEQDQAIWDFKERMTALISQAKELESNFGV